MEKISNGRVPSSARVYLVAENRLLRETLVRLFQKRSGISVVAESRYCDTTAQQVAKRECDALLLDSLTTPQAIDLVEDLSEEAPQTKVILFAMDEDGDCFLRGVRLGIRGYLLKDASSAEVIAAVQAVLRGEAVCPPTLCALLFEFVAKEFSRRAGVADPQACTSFGLTYRQRQLMALVAQGLTNKEIAASLNLSEFTVKNHIHRIMKQVDADTRYEAVDMIRASGFIPVA